MGRDGSARPRLVSVCVRSGIPAAFALAHTAQQGLHSGNPIATILFDIQGFYDNIRCDRIVYLLDIFGFPTAIVDWVRSFLSNRSVWLPLHVHVLPPRHPRRLRQTFRKGRRKGIVDGWPRCSQSTQRCATPTPTHFIRSSFFGDW